MDTKRSAIEITLADGQEARGDSYRAEVLVLVAPIAFAPGQPLTMQARAGESDAVSLVGKAIGSKKRADGAFDVRVRLHSLRREQRAWLEQVFDGTGA